MIMIMIMITIIMIIIFTYGSARITAKAREANKLKCTYSQIRDITTESSVHGDEAS